MPDAKDKATPRRKKGLNKITTPRSFDKFTSEMVRSVYYMSLGYVGPHPWGPLARPPYPEFSPLPVKDEEAEPELRKAIDKVISSSRWSVVLKRLLREIEKEL